MDATGGPQRCKWRFDREPRYLENFDSVAESFLQSAAEKVASLIQQKGFAAVDDLAMGSGLGRHFQILGEDDGLLDDGALGGVRASKVAAFMGGSHGRSIRSPLLTPLGIECQKPLTHLNSGDSCHKPPAQVSTNVADPSRAIDHEVDSIGKRIVPVVSFGTEATVLESTLSVVIPAFNEQERLPAFLNEVRQHLERAGLDGYEVIIVDDGSTDATAQLIGQLAGSWPNLRLLSHGRNLGKGAAVRLGVLSARFDLILFADADGATPMSEERSLREAIVAGADLAAGSRLVGGSKAVIRAPHRAILGRIFALAVRAAVPVGIRDPQCGFKMFRGQVGRHLFEICAEDGYLFDLEVLAMAERLGYRAVEVAVRWREMPGSKVRLLRDTWKMVRGVVRVRRSVGRFPDTRDAIRGRPALPVAG